MAVQSLFGGQIVDRSQYAAVVDSQRGLVLVRDARQSQVGDLEHAFAVDQQVGGLDVAVDQSHLVGKSQAVGSLRDVVRGQPILEGAVAIQQRLQAGAVHIFHDQVMEPAVGVKIVAANDVGMVQRGGDPRFAIEPHQVRTIAGSLQMQDFDRHPAPQQRVFRQVNGTHATGSDLGHQLVLAKEVSLPESAQQHPVLPGGDQLSIHQRLGDHQRIAGQSPMFLLHFIEQRIQLIGLDQTAPSERVQVCVNRQRRHRHLPELSLSNKRASWWCTYCPKRNKELRGTAHRRDRSFRPATSLVEPNYDCTRFFAKAARQSLTHPIP